MPSAGVTCPWCFHTIDKRGLALGSRVRCPHCRAAFTLGPEDFRPTLARRPLLALGAAALGLLLLLAAGTVLALHFAPTRPSQHAALPLAAAPTDDRPDASVDPDSSTLRRKPLPDYAPTPGPPPILDPPSDAARGELPPELQAKVNQAIDRGVACLRKRQNPDGSWRYTDASVQFPDQGHATFGWPEGDAINAKALEAPWRDAFPVGHAALSGLTLLECDVAAADPQVLGAAKYVRSHLSGLNLTYELALAILFLDRLGDPEDEPRIQALARQLLAAQTPAGGWNYRCRALPPADDSNYWLALQANRPTSALELIAARPGEAGVRPGGPDAEAASKALDALPPALRSTIALQPPVTDDDFPAGDISDNSNTQFALLALWVAGRHDVPVQRALVRTARRFRLSQRADGEWSYTFQPKGDQPGRPAMTAAGLLGLAVGYGASAGLKGDAPPREAGRDAAVDQGMEALRRRMDPPPSNPLDLYLLWSVERVGVLYNRRTVGDKEWYPWGASPLVECQQADGGWGGAHAGATEVNSTCFALLFLKRANLAPDLTTRLQFLAEDRTKGPRR